MPGKKSGGFMGLIRTINDVSRAANNVNRTKNNVKRMVGASKTANPPKGVAVPAGKAAPDPNVWTCVCGTSNTTKFCGSCGKAAPAEVACPNCGWKRPAGNSDIKFCGECGAKFPE